MPLPHTVSYLGIRHPARPLAPRWGAGVEGIGYPGSLTRPWAGICDAVWRREGNAIVARMRDVVGVVRAMQLSRACAMLWAGEELRYRCAHADGRRRRRSANCRAHARCCGRREGNAIVAGMRDVVGGGGIALSLCARGWPTASEECAIVAGMRDVVGGGGIALSLCARGWPTASEECAIVARTRDVVGVVRAMQLSRACAMLLAGDELRYRCAHADGRRRRTLSFLWPRATLTLAWGKPQASPQEPGPANTRTLKACPNDAERNCVSVWARVAVPAARRMPLTLTYHSCLNKLSMFARYESSMMPSSATCSKLFNS